MEEVKASSAWVATNSSHVFVDNSGLEKVVDELHGTIPSVDWDFEGIHYFDNGPLTVQYLFVLDTLNFCFWPDEELHYDHLAAGLKKAVENDNSVFDADRLISYTGPDLRRLLKWSRPLPLEDERVRLLHEVGTELEKSFEGKAANLVTAAHNSAEALVELITRHFPGFRDHSVYKGHQIFLYKRAQIFVADLWGAFKGKGYGAFQDIGSITIFADYIVPAVLRQLGVLTYSPSLSMIVDGNRELASGSEEEVEIRACTIYAVEKLRDLIGSRVGKEVCIQEICRVQNIEVPLLQQNVDLPDNFLVGYKSSHFSFGTQSDISGLKFRCMFQVTCQTLFLDIKVILQLCYLQVIVSQLLLNCRLLRVWESYNMGFATVHSYAVFAKS